MNSPCLVLDCSIVLAFFMPDEASEYATAVLRSLTVQEAIVPAVWPLEVSNGLLVAQRRGRIAREDYKQFLQDIRQLRLIVDPIQSEVVFDEVVSLAEQFGLSSYDASYLELALRANLPVATLDQKLLRAVIEAGLNQYQP